MRTSELHAESELRTISCIAQDQMKLIYDPISDLKLMIQVENIGRHLNDIKAK